MASIEYSSQGATCSDCRAPLRVSVLVPVSLMVHGTSLVQEQAPELASGDTVQCDNCDATMGDYGSIQDALQSAYDNYQVLREYEANGV